MHQFDSTISHINKYIYLNVVIRNYRHEKVQTFKIEAKIINHMPFNNCFIL